MRRNDSSAIWSTIGFACGEYSASTAWAIALTPLVTDSRTGMPSVRSTS